MLNYWIPQRNDIFNILFNILFFFFTFSFRSNLSSDSSSLIHTHKVWRILFLDDSKYRNNSLAKARPEIVRKKIFFRGQGGGKSSESAILKGRRFSPEVVSFYLLKLCFSKVCTYVSYTWVYLYILHKKKLCRDCMYIRKYACINFLETYLGTIHTYACVSLKKSSRVKCQSLKSVSFEPLRRFP